MTKRHRTFWVVRRRFKLAQWASAAVGGAAGTAAVVQLAAAGTPPAGLPGGLLLEGAAAVALGAGAPWLAVGALWRRWCRSRHEEWR